MGCSNIYSVACIFCVTQIIAPCYTNFFESNHKINEKHLREPSDFKKLPFQKKHTNTYRDSEGNINTIEKVQKLIYMVEILDPGTRIPDIADKYPGIRDLFIDKEKPLENKEMKADFDLAGESQMTILGSEMNNLYKEFFKNINAQNITTKIETDKRLVKRIYAFLKGLGDDWEFLSVKAANTQGDAFDRKILPPLKLQSKNWMRKYKKWRAMKKKYLLKKVSSRILHKKTSENSERKLQSETDFMSKFIVNRNNPNFIKLTQRNKITSGGRYNEDNYLFNTEKTCPKIVNYLQTFGIKNTKDASKGTQVHNLNYIYNDMYDKAAVKPRHKYEIFKKNSKKLYEYQVLKAFALMCIWDFEYKNAEERKCSDVAYNNSIAFVKFDLFGNRNWHVIRMKQNVMLHEIMDKMNIIKKQRGRNDKKEDNPETNEHNKQTEEKFRVYMSKNSINMIAAFLQTFGFVQDPKAYRGIISTVSDLRFTAHLNRGPLMGSNLTFSLREIKTTVNKGPVDTKYAVDINYNGIPINYCKEEKSLDGVCSFDFFKDYVMGKVMSTSEFVNNCETKNSNFQKFFIWFFIIGLALAAVYLALYEIKEEKTKLPQRSLQRVDARKNLEESAIIVTDKNNLQAGLDILKDDQAGMGLQVNVDAAKMFDSQNSKSLKSDTERIE